MKKLTVKIEGMKCPHCEAHVVECVKKGFKVKSVEASHQSGLAQVVCESIDSETLKKAIEDCGYTVVAIEEQEIEKKGLFGGIFKK